jgi:hypothetical protein
MQLHSDREHHELHKEFAAVANESYTVLISFVVLLDSHFEDNFRPCDV